MLPLQRMWAGNAGMDGLERFEGLWAQRQTMAAGSSWCPMKRGQKPLGCPLLRCMAGCVR